MSYLYNKRWKNENISQNSQLYETKLEIPYYSMTYLCGKIETIINN